MTERAFLADRPPVTHDLKTWPDPFTKVLDGSKTAEVRFNDRDYRVGDTLRLQEYALGSTVSGNDYTGRELSVVVTHVLDLSEWVDEAGGYVMLSFESPALRSLASEKKRLEEERGWLDYLVDWYAREHRCCPRDEVEAQERGKFESNRAALSQQHDEEE